MLLHLREKHRDQVLRTVVTDLANALYDERGVDEPECIIDTMFASPKEGE